DRPEWRVAHQDPHPHHRPEHLEKLSPAILAGRGTYKNARQRPTLPSGYPDSTIGAGGLNFRVRKGNGCFPSAKVTERRKLYRLAGSAPPGAEALDLPSFRGRVVVLTPAHLAHEPLLLHLAAELPKSLLELLRILDYDSHSRTRIPAAASPAPVLALQGPRHAGWGGAGSTGRRAEPAGPAAPPARPAPRCPPGHGRERSAAPRRCRPRTGSARRPGRARP